MDENNSDKDLLIANFFTGVNDGLIVPFVVGMLALALTQQALKSVLFFAIAIIIGALAYGLSRYYGELEEIEHNHPGFSVAEFEKELKMMKYIGISEEIRGEMRRKVLNEKTRWMEEVRENQLDWEEPDKRRSLKGGIQTGLSFFAGGIISLLVFGIALQFQTRFSISFFLSTVIPILALLVVTGGTKARFTGRPFFEGAVFSFTYGIFSLTMPAIVAWLLITQS